MLDALCRRRGKFGPSRRVPLFMAKIAKMMGFSFKEIASHWHYHFSGPQIENSFVNGVNWKVSMCFLQLNEWRSQNLGLEDQQSYIGFLPRYLYQVVKKTTRKSLEHVIASATTHLPWKEQMQEVGAVVMGVGLRTKENQNFDCTFQCLRQQIRRFKPCRLYVSQKCAIPPRRWL